MRTLNNNHLNEIQLVNAKLRNELTEEEVYTSGSYLTNKMMFRRSITEVLRIYTILETTTLLLLSLSVIVL